MDMLSIKLDESSNFYGHEDEMGIVLNYDFDSKKLVGIDIWDFKYRLENKAEILLPIEVSLVDIYKSLPN